MRLTGTCLLHLFEGLFENDFYIKESPNQPTNHLVSAEKGWLSVGLMMDSNICGWFSEAAIRIALLQGNRQLM